MTMLARLGLGVFLITAALAPMASAAADPSVSLPWTAKTGTDGDAAVRALAVEAIGRYKEPDRATWLSVVAQLQLTARRYDDAERSLAELETLRKTGPQPLDAAGPIVWRIYARTRQTETARHLPFAEAYAKAFHEIVEALDDVTASQVIAGFGTAIEPYGPQPEQMRQAYSAALEAQTGKSAITLPDAIALVKAYQAAEAYTAFRPYTDALADQDDRRRYDVREPILIKTPDGASVTVLTLLPKQRQAKLPTLLGFTIYANAAWSALDMRLTAAHGYAAVVGYSRGKDLSPDTAVPYEHDGIDADAVIEWIAKQPWSDGRVGMYGGSYNGFTQWAAAKHRPAALKALMPSVTVAPGIDVPMEGGVGFDFIYPWIPYVTDRKDLDQAHYDDGAHWYGLYRRWYESGKPFRALDELNGRPNPVFQRWLDHPAYDAYWQTMIPYREEFAAIDIPVLTTTGYYDGAQIGALYYYQQHERYNPRAEHYLLIGPWDHVGAQRKARPVVNGYAIDEVAKQDIGRVIRYQWFDYVFRGAPKPALLADKVNYQVMGTNTWKHASTVAAMSQGRRRFYLANDGKTLRLADQPSTRPSELTVDLARRDDLPPEDALRPGGVDGRNGLIFTSDPLPAGTEISGLFSGKLKVITNKRDFDLRVTLYEKKADGSVMQLSWYLARASFIEDRSKRQLLRPGQPSTLAFTNGRTTSRQFEPGSRLVMTVSVNKDEGSSVNMGSGKPVSDESVADGGEPLTLRWLPDSYLDIPVTVNATTGAAKVSAHTP